MIVNQGAHRSASHHLAQRRHPQRIDMRLLEALVDAGGVGDAGSRIGVDLITEQQKQVGRIGALGAIE